MTQALVSTTRALHVGVVYGADTVHFVAASYTRDGLTRRIAGYVGAQAETQLYSEDAAALRELLARRDAEGAVRFYFDRVGKRWDAEWLRADVLAVGPDDGPEPAGPAGGAC